MRKTRIRVFRMTSERRIFSLQNSEIRDVATRALYEVRRPSLREIWLPAAGVAYRNDSRLANQLPCLKFP